MVHLESEQINDLILEQLFDFRQLGFTSLLDKIHAFQEKNPKSYWGKLSKRTLVKYLDRLISENIVVRKKGKTEKREIYALAENNDYMSFGGIIESLSEALAKLEADNRKPFFNLLVLLPKLEKGNQLENLRDDLIGAAERLDKYIQFKKTQAGTASLDAKKRAARSARQPRGAAD